MTAHLFLTRGPDNPPHHFWADSDERTRFDLGDGTVIELWEEPPHAEPSPEPEQRTYEVVFALPGGNTSKTEVKAASFNINDEYGVARFWGPETGAAPTRSCVATIANVLSVIDVTDEQDVPAEGDGATEPEPDIPCHSSVDLNPGDLGA